MPRKCSFVEDSGRQCRRVGTGNPPLCEEHWNVVEDEETDMVEDFVEAVMDHPKVQGGFNRVASVLDRFTAMIDNVAAGRRPGGERWSEQPPPGPQPTGSSQPRRPPPRQERRQRPPSAADDAAEARRQKAEAFIVLGIDSSVPLTKEILAERKKTLSRVYHPDLNKNGSVEMMKRINAAHDLLLATLRGGG